MSNTDKTALSLATGYVRLAILVGVVVDLRVQANLSATSMVADVLWWPVNFAQLANDGMASMLGIALLGTALVAVVSQIEGIVLSSTRPAGGRAGHDHELGTADVIPVLPLAVVPASDLPHAVPVPAANGVPAAKA